MPTVAFMRWDPVRDLLTLHDQLGHMVGADAPGWTPAVDLCETPDAFIMTAELPGLDREAIDIQAEEQRIAIRGERRAGHAECEQYHRVERGQGRFSRAFVLPEPIDVELVSAGLQDGVLTVTLPKALGRGARRIDID